MAIGLNCPLEHDEQVAYIQWADMFFNNLDCFVFSIPNGGKRNKVVAVKLKKEGVKKGIPDLFLCQARHGYHGLFIEMKRLKGGSLSKDQKKKKFLLEKQGYAVAVCKGADHAIRVTKSYMLDDELNFE